MRCKSFIAKITPEKLLKLPLKHDFVYITLYSNMDVWYFIYVIMYNIINYKKIKVYTFVPFLPYVCSWNLYQLNVHMMGLCWTRINPGHAVNSSSLTLDKSLNPLGPYMAQQWNEEDISNTHFSLIHSFIETNFFRITHSMSSAFLFSV